MANPDPSRERYRYIPLDNEHIYTPTGVLLVVDIYPVGIFLDIKTSWKSKKYKLHLKRDLLGHIRKREWRSFKNTFNGYLAEPDVMPGKLKRCGSGWTRKRALRDLKRRVGKS